MIVNFFPDHWTHEHRIEHGIIEIITNQKLQLEKLEKIMAAIDDLNTALGTLTTDVQALIAKPTGTSDAQIQAVTGLVNSLDATVKAALPTPATT